MLANRLVPGPSAGGLGPLSGKQFAIYGGSIAVGLVVLLGGLLILTRRNGRQAKDEVQAVPSLAAAGAIDMTATVPRIAVLPFANVSGDTAQDYFCDGITENIITRLSRFRDLFVISSNSSFTYKNKSVTTQDVSRELGVTYVLQGSVQRSADRIRITVQLVDGASGGNLWAERYDRGIDEVFAVQDEVTELIVARFSQAPMEDGCKRLGKSAPTPTEAARGICSLWTIFSAVWIY